MQRSSLSLGRLVVLPFILLLVMPGYSLSAQQRVIEVEQAGSLDTFLDDGGDERYFELSGDVRIVLDDKENGTIHRIRADQILFNRDKQLLSARGNIAYELERDGSIEIFRGESLLFNTGNWSGTFFSGESSREQQVEEKTITFHFGGRVIQRFEDGSVVLHDGVISSSGLEEPYYRIEANKIIILRPGEWAVKNATFYLGRVPLLPLPFFFMPGDKFFLHPSFGYNMTKGYFLQTTAYLKGKAPASREGGLSFMQNLDTDTGNHIYERDGFFLTRKPVTEQQKPNDDYIKLITDYYTLLGGHLALEGSLKEFKGWNDLSFFLGLSVTKEIIEAPEYGYTTLIENDGIYEPQWQQAWFLGSRIPFRFGSELKSSRSFSPWFQLAVSLPLYSDPHMRSIFLPRQEGLQLRRFIDPDAVLDTEEQGRTTLVPSIGIRSSRPIPLIPSTDLLFQLDKLEIRSTVPSINVSSETLYPLSYYYPETLVAPDVAFRITGTVFDTSSPVPDRKESSDIPSISPPPALTEHEIAGKGTSETGIIPPPSISVISAPAPEASSPLFRNSLGFQLQPRYSMQNIYNIEGKNSPETVDLNRDYAIQRLGGNASLTYKADLWRQLFSIENRTLFTGNYQAHQVYSDAVDPDYGSDSDDVAGRYNVGNQFTASWRPFLNHDLWKQSSLVYQGNGTLLSGRWEQEPERSFNHIPLSWDDKSITSHLLTATALRREDVSRQQFSLSLQLPPLEQQVKPQFELEEKAWKLSGKGSFRRTDGLWLSDPLSFQLLLRPRDWFVFEEELSFAMDSDDSDYATSSLKLSFFEERLLTGHGLTWDLTEQQIAQYETNMRIFPFHASFLAKQEYNYTISPLGEGWQKDGELQLRPYSLKTGFLLNFEPEPLWKGRIETELLVKSSWEMNFLRYSENFFSFDLSFKFSLAEFLDLEIVSVSSNRSMYRYFDAYAITPANIFQDLLNSFAFHDRSKRLQSNFNLENLSIKAVHHMKDWDLNFVYLGKPVLRTAEGSLPGYQWQPEFSIFLQWRPIPELKKEISYRDSTFDW
jgi:hypothetical protein